MDNHFGDRLTSAIGKKDAPVCVGFDPLIDRLPPSLLEEHGVGAKYDLDLRTNANLGGLADAILAFGEEIIRVVAPHVPAVKINIAFFERYHTAGIRAYHRLVRHASELGLVVIGDVKRADIGHSTTQYAYAQLGPIPHPGLDEVATPDAVTVNPYFGYDGIRPFVELARETGDGLFVLVQTSNESAVQVQGLILSDGTTVCEQVARLVQKWATAEAPVGSSGYSCIGAVVSPRDLESTERIRGLMPNCIFLVPGFGAQGRTGDEVAKCFKSDGTGAIVNASRSVIYAYREAQYRDRYGDDWRQAVDHACQDFVTAVRAAVTR